MLYLAEVLKKSGVFGSGKTELRLLASQRGEYNWVPVPGDDVIPADDSGNFNSGALVFADLNASKQVQGNLKEASGQLVKILQNFSRFQEKFKTQEEEIEQWKQSLTYQSQELNRREMEMEAHREEVDNVQQDLARLETKQGEIEAQQGEIDRLRQEVEQSRQELESAWTQLQGEREELQGSGSVDAEQASSLQQWLDYLSEVMLQPQELQESLTRMQEQLAAQEAWLEERMAQLEDWRNQAQEHQSQLDEAVQGLDVGWGEWHQSQLELAGQRTDMAVRERLVAVKDELLQGLRTQLSGLDEMAKQLSSLSSGAAPTATGADVDLSELERMPLNNLQERVRQLQNELETGMRLVIDVQEELMLQRLDLNELEAKVARASGGDRTSLEAELADLQESYGFLNDTLVGQRRSLRERERIMNQHQSVLWRRLGNPPEPVSSGGTVDVSPVLSRLGEQQQRLQQQVPTLEGEVDSLRRELEELRGQVEQEATAGEGQLQELKDRDRQLRDQRAEIAQTWGRVNAYQELLDALRDRLTHLKETTDPLAGSLEHLQELADSQQNAVTQLQGVVGQLTAAE